MEGVEQPTTFSLKPWKKIEAIETSVTELKIGQAEIKGEVKALDKKKIILKKIIKKIDGIDRSLWNKIDGIDKRMSNQDFVNRVALSALLGAVFTAILTAIRYFWFIK